MTEATSEPIVQNPKFTASFYQDAAVIGGDLTKAVEQRSCMAYRPRHPSPLDPWRLAVAGVAGKLSSHVHPQG